MNKILISGYYGFNNLGDEAILETIIHRIRHAIPASDIRVLSATPERTSENYGVKACNRKQFTSVMKALMDCDVLISGGGSLLQDVTSKLSIKYYLAIILMAKLLGKRVMVYSQGIGPINKESNRILTKWILSLVDCITVREENSKEDLLALGLRGKKIGVTADPVIDLEPVNTSLGASCLQEANETYEASKKTVGFALRSKDFQTEEAYTQLKETIDQLLQSYQLAFIPFHYNEDLVILRRLEADYGKRIVVVTKRYHTTEILAMMGCFEVLIGVRLHSLIFAAVQNTLPIGISYDPKIDYFMQTLGMGVLCEVSAISGKALEQEIERLLANKEEEQEKLKAIVQTLRHKIDENDQALLNLLKRG